MSRKPNDTTLLPILTTFIGVFFDFLAGISVPILSVSKIWVSLNPRGAERLPLGIVASELDLYPRKLWGVPSEDLMSKPRYLVTFTVGYDQRHNIDATVKKFSSNFTTLLFHYDGKTSEWDQYEWLKWAIHVNARKQTKWWFAKRFLHPDIVAAYDYIFIWDEDLGVEHFDAENYVPRVGEKTQVGDLTVGFGPKHRGDLADDKEKRRH